MYISLLPTQVDAKSPVDEALMGTIKDDLDDLDARITVLKTFDYEFKLNGRLKRLPNIPKYRTRIDGALVAAAQTFTRARVYLEEPGTAGDLEVDIRRYRTPNTPIMSIARQYSANINSISQIAPALATQSITALTPQISTQSISDWKGNLNIASIILIGANLVRINFTTPLDDDWLVGDTITISGATAGANNISTPIVRVNDDGASNIVIFNPSGVAQTTATGSVSLNAWSYNFTNPVDTDGFVAGEQVVFAGHTAPANDGNFIMYAVNDGGNNIVIKNPSGVSQGAAAGTADACRWVYTYAALVAADFVVGEKARMAGHSSGGNNGDFTIVFVNNIGNNIVVYNTAGVAQGGVAGTANTTRWIYALPTDPTTSFAIGQTFVASGATSANNNGTFTVLEINRLGTNNLVVSNVNGVTQAGAVGTIVHTRMILAFSSDQAALYSLDSRIYVDRVVATANIGEFYVLEINRGGGANYNLVIDNPLGVLQASPCGRIIWESRTLFVNNLKLTNPTLVYNSTNRHLQYDEKSAGTGDFSAAATVVSGDRLAIELISIPEGDPADVVVQLV